LDVNINCIQQPHFVPVNGNLQLQHAHSLPHPFGHRARPTLKKHFQLAVNPRAQRFHNIIRQRKTSGLGRVCDADGGDESMRGERPQNCRPQNATVLNDHTKTRC
jgi:hypothetical protein